jgi:hypothetical protein
MWQYVKYAQDAFIANQTETVSENVISGNWP